MKNNLESKYNHNKLIFKHIHININIIYRFFIK